MKMNKKRKRNEKRQIRNKLKSLKIFGANAASIKCKLKSFDDILTRLCPQIWIMQETKLKPNETLKCDSLKDFQVYYLSRQKSQGGGLAIGVVKDFESTLIREGDDETEAMSVEVVVGPLPIRIINAYGAQETAPKEKKEKLWNFIEEEVIKAEIDGHGIIIQMDGNLHAGPELVKNDPNPQNNNGKMFMEFLERNPTLTVVNSLDICEGLITRSRQLKLKCEKAVLDFFIVNEKVRPFLRKMIVDEVREYGLTNFAQQRKNKRVIESDHNSEILELDIQYSYRKPEREEISNMRNKICQDAFKVETENNPKLLEVFDNQEPFKTQCNMWLKNFNSILHKCFKKVRIVRNKKRGK